MEFRIKLNRIKLNREGRGVGKPFQGESVIFRKDEENFRRTDGRYPSL